MDMPMKTPVHPGRIVRHDCLEPLGLSVTAGAKVLGVTRQTLTKVVNGKSGISPEMAIRLTKAFGSTEETWLRMQLAYDLAAARKDESKIKVRRYSVPQALHVHRRIRAAVAASAFVFSICASFAQSAASPPAFAVASVKPSRHELGRDANSRISIGPAGLRGNNVTLKHLITEAYRVQPYQVFGGPNWLDIDEYDVEAKTDGPTTSEQAALMLRGLLTDRFRLSLHREARELRVYDLVGDKHGAKIRATKDAETPATKAGAAGVRSFHGDLQQFADLLSIQLSIAVSDDPGRPGRASGQPVPVRDKTGLSGIFDFSVEVKPEAGADMLALWQGVLQDQLGLKLESRKAPVEVLVIERAERIPVAN
jgi:addiction module HigA family antidote